MCETVGPEILICAPPPYDGRTRSPYTAHDTTLPECRGPLTAPSTPPLPCRSRSRWNDDHDRNSTFDRYGQIDAYHTSTTFAQSAATAACVPVTLLRSNVPDRTRTPGVPDRRTRHSDRSVPLFFFFFFTSTHTHTRARVHIRTLAMASRLVCACWWWSSGGGPSLSCYRLNSILKKPIISDKSALGFYY